MYHILVLYTLLVYNVNGYLVTLQLSLENEADMTPGKRSELAESEHSEWYRRNEQGRKPRRGAPVIHRLSMAIALNKRTSACVGGVALGSNRW